MAALTEGKRTAEFVLSEANGDRSRENVVVVSGQNLTAGAVVGKITASGKYKEYNPGNADGSQTAVGVLYASTDATSADAKGVIYARDCEVRKADLVWFTGATAPQQATGITALAALGILARD